MKAVIIYGSDSGMTENVASAMARQLGGRAIDILVATTADFENADLLILGTPTYGDGALQGAWEERLDLLRAADLSGKRVALFGLGDQSSYPDTFVDAMSELHDVVSERGAMVVGATATDGYEFAGSRAIRDGKFVGLVLDDNNQAGKTDRRIAAWLAAIA